MAIRRELLHEVTVMAFETVRTQKLRSALTILGVVIGITSIVGMTSLIRGFDQSLRDTIKTLGPRTVFVAKFSGVSLASGQAFWDLIRRPNLTLGDARAIARAETVDRVDTILGRGPSGIQERLSYGSERTKRLIVIGASANFAEVNSIPLDMGRLFTDYEVEHRRPVIALGQSAYQALFKNVDPIGKEVRLRGDRFRVIGVFAKAPSLGGFDTGQDDFALLPYRTYQKEFGSRGVLLRGIRHLDLMIGVVPKDEVSREDAMAEVEQIMRIRHGLKLDEASDFDLVTQDAVLKVWDQVSGATFLALVVISSIALLVGGIGVMAIMMISVTERTREIGVRKALGARRREILWQFLLEAAFLTSMGGIIGIVMGSAVGFGVHVFARFPVSLPWWSFAIGIGFSASVGIFFGLFPAIRASRLDPIEALRYE
ncbi:MAG: ABC transporter permease [Vicinamibacterales bacterium]